MALAVYLIDMLTGRYISPVPVSKADWKLTTNADEDLSCTIPTRAPEVRKLGIWDASRLGATGLAMEVDGLPVGAGPIWKRKYTPASGELTLSAGGLRSYLERRFILPAAARGKSLVDPNGDPLAEFDTTLTAADPGGILQGVIALAQLWPGGTLPIDFGTIRSGTGTTTTIYATDLKTIGSLITDTQNAENGPDIAFRPRRSTDGRGLYWELQMGTPAKPRLGSTDPAGIKFRYGGAGATATNLEVEEDGTDLTMDAWQRAGSGTDGILMAEAYDPTLINRGYPLLQSLDSSHDDAETTAELASYARQDVKLGRYAYSQWSMDVRSHVRNRWGGRGAPELSSGDYWLGDMATVTIDKSDPVFGGDDDYTVVRRIAALSGDLDDREYGMTFAEDVVTV